MKFSLDPKASLASNLRQVADDQVTSAAAEIHQLPAEEAVHEVRKHCKKIRALLRLVRVEIADLYRYENAHYRALANSLAGSRDAVSVRDALLGLAPPQRYPQILSFLEQRTQGHRDEDALAGAALLLQQGEERIGDWPLEQLKWKHARRGYQRGYKRAVKAMHSAFVEESAASIHEFRKRAKDHWYHSLLLAKKHPDTIGGRCKPLKNLAQALGDWRDLRLLCSLLSENSEQFSGELIPLLDDAERRLQDLHREIEKLSRKLFSTDKLAFPK